MKTLKNIIESNNEPKTDNIWLKNGDLKHFKNGKWESLTKSSSYIDDIKDRVNSLDTKIATTNKEVYNIKSNYIYKGFVQDSMNPFSNYLVNGPDHDGIYYSMYSTKDEIFLNFKDTYSFLKDKNTDFDTAEFFRVGNPSNISFMSYNTIGVLDREYASYLDKNSLIFYSNTGNAFRIECKESNIDPYFSIAEYTKGGKSLTWKISREGVNLGGDGKVLLDNGKSIAIAKGSGKVTGLAYINEYNIISSEFIEEASLYHRGTIKKAAKIADLPTSATLEDCVNKINELLKNLRDAGILEKNS